ncbi:conserved protein [environmental halophage 1 AAJ-2005]|nr:conserved protein [environmental halophage 1 AAJ-2005]
MNRDTTDNESTTGSTPQFPTEDPHMTARFVPTSRHVATTFEEPNLRKYAVGHAQGRVLNACAGETQLDQWYDDGEIVRNDLHPDIPSEYSVDIAELASEFPPNSFDTILFDPPWSAYQSRMRYDGYVVHKAPTDELPTQQINIDVRELPFTVPGEYAHTGENTGNKQMTLTNDYSGGETRSECSRLNDSHAGDTGDTPRERGVDPHTKKNQLGHARLAKLGFDYLLRDGGRVIQFAYTGSVMAASLGYTRIDRTAFDPTGTYKTLIGGVDVNR